MKRTGKCTSGGGASHSTVSVVAFVLEGKEDNLVSSAGELQVCFLRRSCGKQEPGRRKLPQGDSEEAGGDLGISMTAQRLKALLGFGDPHFRSPTGTPGLLCRHCCPRPRQLEQRRPRSQLLCLPEVRPGDGGTATRDVQRSRWHTVSSSVVIKGALFCPER